MKNLTFETVSTVFFSTVIILGFIAVVVKTLFLS